MDEEATEDLEKMNAITALEDSYLETHPVSMMKKFQGWQKSTVPVTSCSSGFACACATEADAADAMKTMHSMKFFMPLFYHNRVRDAIIASSPNRVVAPSAEFCLNIRV